MAGAASALTWSGTETIATEGEVVDWTPGPGDDQKEAVLGVDDRRFRRQFNLALVRLRAKGEVSGEDYRRYRAASFNVMALEDGKAFIQLLREECERKAGDLLNDLAAWWQWLTEWLVDNWQTVLKVVLSLLVFLG